MRVPVDISFHGISRSETIEELIKKDAVKLEKICPSMVSCRVGVKLDQKSSTTNNPYRIN